MGVNIPVMSGFYPPPPNPPGEGEKYRRLLLQKAILQRSQISKGQDTKASGYCFGDGSAGRFLAAGKVVK